MNRAFSILRKGLFPIMTRAKTTPAESPESPETPNPICLKPICYEAQTLRFHDNETRQVLYEYGLYVAKCMPKYVQRIQMQHTDQLEICIAPEGLFPVLSFLRNHQHGCFNHCACVTAIDVPSREYRIEVLYNLMSLRYNARIRVKTYTDELTPLHSACELWATCNWFEREVYDMFGVVFSHHPDLRRILTDYGFQGHPLRKDFPQVGYYECRYDDEQKRIVYEPVEFSQQLRTYKLDSPWLYHENFNDKYNNPPPPPPPPKK